jgi:hypothetical protein
MTKAVRPPSNRNDAKFSHPVLRNVVERCLLNWPVGTLQRQEESRAPTIWTTLLNIFLKCDINFWQYREALNQAVLATADGQEVLVKVYIR